MTRIWVSLLVGAAFAADVHAGFPPVSIASLPEAAAFIEEMALVHQFDRTALQALFDEAQLKQSILRAIARPAEAKPWRDYRPLFVEPKRIAAGLAFWQMHRAELQRAETSYGVPASIIVAILGVETFYGRQAGAYRVVDALSTLAFGYPPRAAFFRGQLEQFLLMTRELGIAPTGLKGSYAGAMGWPQFMPSSFREYAVDFNQDGVRDLWSDPADVVGSVAYYFKRKGWVSGAPVALPIQPAAATLGLANKGWGYRMPIKHWLAGTASLPAAIDPEAEAMLLALEGANGREYWLGFENFFVITRYNNSFHYAMAVWDLAQALAVAQDRVRPR